MQEEEIQQFEGLIKQEQIFFLNQFSYSFYLITRNQISFSSNFIQHDLLLKPAIITNIEKIMHLRWADKEGKNQKKMDSGQLIRRTKIVMVAVVSIVCFQLTQLLRKYIFNDQEIGGGQQQGWKMD
ncbi:unnamed protein product [Paramecium pentaurelia]|uniref:Uncharacterized protein n=1 Tax=Paramecium pentaurelia TaxID=43138 RepID=A0A8S1YJE3_9CILI|nr:unnamed protein product [Paramecium pentaurelia]CAD8213973.1 unnamed protein product [Paramecium pentaurelia]